MLFDVATRAPTPALFGACDTPIVVSHVQRTKDKIRMQQFRIFSNAVCSLSLTQLPLRCLPPCVPYVNSSALDVLIISRMHLLYSACYDSL